MIHEWLEDEFTPRVDRLAEPLASTDESMLVEHPEWFRTGDVVRLGEDDRYPTGEFDEWGNEIYLVRNEAVLVGAKASKRLLIHRGYGANPPQPVGAGAIVMILANTQPT